MLNQNDTGLTTRVLRPHELTPAELNCWHDFCLQRIELRTPFLAPEFTLSAERAGADVRVCILEGRHRIEGFLPFQFSSRMDAFLRAAEPAAAPLNDYFGLIASSDVKLSGQALVTLAGLCYLGFSHLDETQLCHGVEAEKPQPGLQIQLEAGSAEYWKKLRERDKKFVDDTIRRERRLVQDLGPLAFRFRDEPQGGGLERVIEAKSAQYRRSRVYDYFDIPWSRRLLELLSVSAAPGCSGVLSTLYAGSTWVASHFGLTGNGILHYWFPVYNRELRRYAPGRLLLKQIIDISGSHGIRMIDRGVGDSQAKREFANARHTYYRGAWFQPGLRSTLRRFDSSLRWRMMALARACQLRTAGRQGVEPT